MLEVKTDNKPALHVLTTRESLNEFELPKKIQKLKKNKLLKE